MENNIINEFLDDLKDAEMVLVGIGSELAAFDKKTVENMELYREKSAYYKGDDAEVFLNTVRYISSMNNVDIKDAYNQLLEIIKNKNYFIFTSNYDDAIYESEISSGRIVAPCGSQFDFQCSCKAEGSIVKGHGFYDTCSEIVKKDGLNENLFDSIPKCPACGLKMQPASFKNINYNEAIYIKQWELYNKWLSGSLNRKLLVLELGEDFSMPNLIRWPFERIVFLNQKSKIYRVNENFPQIDEQIKEKGKSVNMNTKDFLNLVYRQYIC